MTGKKVILIRKFLESRKSENPSSLLNKARHSGRRGQGLVEYIILLSMVMAVITGLAFFNSEKFRGKLYDHYANAILKPLPQNGNKTSPSDPFFNINNDF